MIKKLIRSKLGFTLIESVVVMVILGFLGIIGFSMAANTADIFVVIADDAEVYNELWVAMERVSRDMETTDAASIIIDSPTQVTITNSKFAAATCPNCSDNSTVITYRLTGTTLERMGDVVGTYYPVATAISIPTGESSLFIKTGSLIAIQMSKTKGDVSLTLRTNIYPNVDLTEDIQ